MIIYSSGGARPAQDALKSFMAMKNRHAVVIRDGKVYHKQGVTQEYLDALVASKYTYCLSEGFMRNEIKIKDAWNPSSFCTSENNQHWVGVCGDKMQPFGESFITENGVVYSDTKWKPQPKFALVTATSSVTNVYLREVLQLLTKEYPGESGCFWDDTAKVWRNGYSKVERAPYGYAGKIRIDRVGGWQIVEDALDVDMDTLIDGGTKGKTIRKIKKYVLGYVKEMKDSASKKVGFTYFESEYYKAELQGVYIFYSACKILMRNRKKICRANLTKILSEIKYEWHNISQSVSRPEDYYDGHIIELDNML